MYMYKPKPIPKATSAAKCIANDFPPIKSQWKKTKGKPITETRAATVKKSHEFDDIQLSPGSLSMFNMNMYAKNRRSNAGNKANIGYQFFVTAQPAI